LHKISEQIAIFPLLMAFTVETECVHCLVGTSL